MSDEQKIKITAFVDFILTKMDAKEALTKLIATNTHHYEKLKLEKQEDNPEMVSPYFILVAAAMDLGWDLAIEKNHPTIRGISVVLRTILKIYLKMTKTKTFLLLEDRPERTPQSIGNYILPVELRPMYRKENWQIVRSYDEFVDWILKNGLPDVVSFDHDLADEHYTFVGDYSKLKVKTGYHAAKWMVDFCLHEGYELPEWYVHSMNPVGADNIKQYLAGFEKFKVKNAEYGKEIEQGAGHSENGTTQSENENEQGVQS